MKLIDQNNANAPEQLSFVLTTSDEASEARKWIHGLDFLDSPSYASLHQEQESKTGQFVSLSAALHIASLVLVSMIVIPVIEQQKTETITIDLTSSPSVSSAPAVEKPQAAPVIKVEKAVKAPKAVKSVSKNSEDIYKAAEAKIEKVKPVKVKPVKVKAVKAPVRAQPQSRIRGGVSQAPKVITMPPQTLDDIAAPDLDQKTLQESTAVGDIDDKVFSEDFNRIDKKQAAALAKEKAAMRAQADQLASENEAALAAVEQQNQNEAQRALLAREARRAQEGQSVQEAIAGEKADAQARGKALQGLVPKEGSGTASSGSSAKGIRQLKDLKQVPGNPKPQYDSDERLRGEQGRSVFLAYISKEGSISQVRLMSVSGYRNLDAKALKAVKKWRFYPGQEGWVEIPIQWDLKGESQEKPTLLRRTTT